MSIWNPVLSPVILSRLRSCTDSAGNGKNARFLFVPQQRKIIFKMPNGGETQLCFSAVFPIYFFVSVSVKLLAIAPR